MYTLSTLILDTHSMRWILMQLQMNRVESSRIQLTLNSQEETATKTIPSTSTTTTIMTIVNRLSKSEKIIVCVIAGKVEKK